MLHQGGMLQGGMLHGGMMHAGNVAWEDTSQESIFTWGDVVQGAGAPGRVLLLQRWVNFTSNKIKHITVPFYQFI